MVLVVDKSLSKAAGGFLQVQLTGLIKSVLVNDRLDYQEGKREFYTH